MSAQSEQINLRINALRLARMNAQKMRLLAAERAEKLEQQLKAAAEAGLRKEISRGLAARDALCSVSRPAVANPVANPQARSPVNRTRTARYTGVAAFGLVLCVATLGLGWVPAQNATVRAAATSSPMLNTEAGDPLRLTLSYSVSLPATR